MDLPIRKPKEPTDKQLALIATLCHQLEVEAEEIGEVYSSDIADEVIKELLAQFPPTKAQMKYVTGLCKKRHMPVPSDLNKETAAEFIRDLKMEQ